MIKSALVIIVVTVFYVKPQFIEPTQRYPHAEVYRYDEDYELIVSNLQLKWNHANAVCHNAYGGWLASLDMTPYQLFVAEAMSESNMNFDALWVALRRNESSFRWVDSHIIVPDEDLVKCGNNSMALQNSEDCKNCSDQKDCGAFVRANHTSSCLVNVNCNALRGFICKRYTSEDSSSHSGWIKIGRRLYKIFFPKLSYIDAQKACMKYDKKAGLAVVATFHDAQVLGRYVLIGRPSLERVWIGAQWITDNYEFEAESIILSNKSDSSNYPPWRNGETSYPSGCVLLDRHLQNLTYFVECACDRLQSYMCYKLVEKQNPVDVCNVGDYDWRIYYQKLSWLKASSVCTKSAPTGRLAIVERKDLKNFVYIMESRIKYLLHVWLGAYYSNGVWTWSYTNNTLSAKEENGYPPWVVNTTYNKDVEQNNLCLNIDRENSIVPIFYGALCKYPQTFICQYDKGTICSNISTTAMTTILTTTTTATTRMATTSMKTTHKTTTMSTTTSGKTTHKETTPTRTTQKPTTMSTTTSRKTTHNETTPTRTTHKTTTMSTTSSRKTTPKKTTPTRTTHKTTTHHKKTKRTQHTTKTKHTKATHKHTTRTTHKKTTHPKKTKHTRPTKKTKHTKTTPKKITRTTGGGDLYTSTTEWFQKIQNVAG